MHARLLSLLALAVVGSAACTRASAPAPSPDRGTEADSAPVATTVAATPPPTTIPTLHGPMPAKPTPAAPTPTPRAGGTMVEIKLAAMRGTSHRAIVHSVEVDDTDAYFTDATGALWKAPKDGTGTATTIVSDPKHRVLTFFLRKGEVTFTTARGIGRVSTSGGSVSILSRENEDPIQLVADEKEMFFSMFDGTTLRREPIAGGTSSAFGAIGIKHGGIALDATHLYVADYRTGVVSRIARAGGGTATLASGLTRPVAIGADATHVYVSVEGDSSLRRVPKGGGTVQVLATGQPQIDTPVIDATHVYWSTWSKPTHSVMRTKKDGSGQPEVVVDGLQSPSHVALDDKRVWVANRDAGSVVGVTK
jgi:hypothetical protein